MRRRRAGILLGMGIFPILIAIIYVIIQSGIGKDLPFAYSGTIFGIAIIEDDEAVRGKRKCESAVNPGVYYEGALLPYDESGVVYLSQPLNERWSGKLSTGQENTYLCIVDDIYLEEPQRAIKDGHEFTLYFFDEEKYYPLKLVVTGMPVIAITEEYSEDPEEVDYIEDPDKWTFGMEVIYHGQIAVFDPGNSKRRYNITESALEYNEKGMLTRYYPKRSYSMELKDPSGGDLDKALLGMNMQSSWKLNAMLSDKSRLREMTAWQIWDQFDRTNRNVSEPGAHMEYVELVLDNQYRGLYALVESVTADKLGVDRNDILYKTVGEVVPSEEEMQQAVDEKWKYMISFRIRRPKEIDDYTAAWFPMIDFLNTFYRERPIDYESAIDKVNLENIVDNYIFLMVTSACDNSLKNGYFHARVDELPQYTMYRIPWDLDYTFGNYFSLDGEYNTIFNPDFTVAGTVKYSDINFLDYGEKVLPQLLLSNPDAVEPVFLNRWYECRDSFLSNEEVDNLIIKNRNYLVDTGALEREKRVWTEPEISSDVDEIIKYVNNRLDWLDFYFEQIAER